MNIFKKIKQQREIRRDYEFLPSTIEVMERPPAPFSRVMAFFIIILAASVISWAYFAKMDIVVSGTGVVVFKGKVKVIQPLEPGIVNAIYIRDGQQVKKGEQLVKLDSTDSVADLNVLQKELVKTELTIANLKSRLKNDETEFISSVNGIKETDKESFTIHYQLLLQALHAQRKRIVTMDIEISRCGAELESIRSNVQRLESSLPLISKLYNKKKALAEKGMIAEGDFLDTQIEMTYAQKNLETEKKREKETKLRLAKAHKEKELAQSQYKQKLLSELAESETRYKNLLQQLVKAEKKEKNRILKSPIDGIVQQLSIHTVGGVVTAAQPLMVIVPIDDGLEIEAKLLNKDIGFVTQGKDVSVKVNAYPFTSYGDLTGKVEWVARDMVLDQQMGPIYPVKVSIHTYKLPNKVNGRRGIITPGMTVTTDIKVGTRRVIDYFLGPIMRYKDKSLREV